MGKLAKQLGLDAMGPTFTGPPSHINPYSDFWPLSNVSFLKVSAGLPMSLHQPDCSWATSTSLQLSQASSPLWLPLAHVPAYSYLTPWQCPKLLQEGKPLPGPETGLLSNTQKWLSEERHADKARCFIGKCTLVETNRVREPRRTALPCGLPSRVLWWWD